MQIGEYLRQRRIRIGKSMSDAAKELFATGKFDQYRNESTFLRTLCTLERDEHRNTHLLKKKLLRDSLLKEWIKVYQADENTLKSLLQELGKQKSRQIIRPANTRGIGNISGGIPPIVFDVVQRSGVSNHIDGSMFGRIIKFVQRLDVNPTPEIIEAYIKSLLSS